MILPLTPSLNVESAILCVDHNEKPHLLDTTKLTRIEICFFLRPHLGVVIIDSSSGFRTLPGSNTGPRYRLQSLRLEYRDWSEEPRS